MCVGTLVRTHTPHYPAAVMLKDIHLDEDVAFSYLLSRHRTLEELNTLRRFGQPSRDSPWPSGARVA
jgi:hypothetical protein